MKYKNWVVWISVVMLLLAVADWPYGYFILLRWVVTASATLIAWFSHSTGKTKWTVVFAIIAFLFNPIAPVYLDKESWVVIDIIVATIFCNFFICYKGKTQALIFLPKI